MKTRFRTFERQSRAQQADAYGSVFLAFVPPVTTARRNAAFATLPDPTAALERCRAVRAQSLVHLPNLLEEFEHNARAGGARIFWARTAEQANRYITDLARKHRVPYVVKGKSMITEEMGLADAMQKAGIDVWESDLGEFILQLLDRPPFHMVGPAINIPPQEIRDIFMKKAGLKKPTDDPVELGRAARLFLREKFRHARMGITGINMAVAQTGTIITVENEGNVRFCKSVPPVQVSVMSIEKLVPRFADAWDVLRVLGRSCTGQGITAYMTMDSGPKNGGDIDGPEELHIVIIDNGRSAIYADPAARSVLGCIRCGACQNVCPVYAQIGGYPYGWVYTGPIGQLLNPLLRGLGRTRDLYHACTLCGACSAVCPAGIDHRRIILHLRHRGASGRWDRLRTPMKSIAMAAYTAAAVYPRLWRSLTKWISVFVNFLYAKSGGIFSMILPAPGWTQHRDLPVFPSETFRERRLQQQRSKRTLARRKP